MALLTDYFQKTKKIQDKIENIPITINTTDKFYEESFQNVQLQCKNENCDNVKAELREKIRLMRSKCAKIEEAIKICAPISKKKDEIIELFRKKNGFESNIHHDTASIVNPQSVEIGSFKSFSDKFDSMQLATLRSFRENEDSSFVLYAIKSMYKERLTALKTRSVTGRGIGKTKVTPEKLKTMEGIFAERVNAMAPDKQSREIKMQKLNKYIKDAIGNVNKSTEKSDFEGRLAEKFLETNIMD